MSYKEKYNPPALPSTQAFGGISHQSVKKQQKKPQTCEMQATQTQRSEEGDGDTVHPDRKQLQATTK